MDGRIRLSRCLQREKKTRKEKGGRCFHFLYLKFGVNLKMYSSNNNNSKKREKKNGKEKAIENLKRKRKRERKKKNIVCGLNPQRFIRHVVAKITNRATTRSRRPSAWLRALQ